ncbi:hypothetical protein BDZ89DRAFT_1162142, partial [Hymenopellis radicata]
MITSRLGVSPTLRRIAFTLRLARVQGTVIAQQRARTVTPHVIRRLFQTSPVLENRRKKRASNPRPKDGSCWTRKDLESYNIHIEEQDPLTFFDLQELPEPTVAGDFLNSTSASDSMFYFNHANAMPGTGEPEFALMAAVNFAGELFDIMGYTTSHDCRAAFGREDLRFRICGKLRHARADMCLVDLEQNMSILLLVREDKGQGQEPNTDVQAQLVAGAVAAFTKNNMNRREAGLDLLSEKVMPGIVIAGTSPTFFKIPVSKTLATHIRGGTYPPDITTVTFCQPPVPRPAQRRMEGMVPLDSRRQILSCYEAFKTVVGI